MSDQLAEEKNIVKIKQTTFSELKECLRKNDFENEHLKSKVVDFTTIQNLQARVKELQSENKHLKSKIVDCKMCQNLQVQVEELKNVNESLNLSVKELYKARALAEVTLRDKDELIFVQSEKIRLLEEQCNPFYEKKVSSSMQQEYNDLLASNDVLKQRLETKFKFLKHDNSLEKMVETIEKEYESNVSKIFITSSTFEIKNLELVKEIGDKVKCFDEDKKAFETKISKLEKVLAQHVCQNKAFKKN
nr:hypothetical protein [Tanacetum cinerariifolium]